MRLLTMQGIMARFTNRFKPFNGFFADVFWRILFMMYLCCPRTAMYTAPVIPPEYHKSFSFPFIRFQVNLPVIIPSAHKHPGPGVGHDGFVWIIAGSRLFIYLHKLINCNKSDQGEYYIYNAVIRFGLIAGVAYRWGLFFFGLGWIGFLSFFLGLFYIGFGRGCNRIHVQTVLAKT